MMRWAPILFLVACWHSNSPGPEPARWQDKTTPTSELLPDGAWLVAEMDIDTSSSEGQHEHERKVLADPSSIETVDHTCSIPANHATFAAYGHDFAFAARGVFRSDAMIECLARLSTSQGKTVTHSLLAGHDVLIAQGEQRSVFLASDTGLIVMANEAVMTRTLAGGMRPLTSDVTLAPLIARARPAQMWVVAKFPRNVGIVGEVLGALDVKLTGQVAALLGSINFTSPVRIEIEIELELASDVPLLAAAFEKKQHELATDPALGSVLGALTVSSDRNFVRVTGSPGQLDWQQVLQLMLGLYGRVQN